MKICFIDKFSKICFEAFSFIFIALRITIYNSGTSNYDNNILINLLFYFSITFLNFEIDEKFLEFMVRKCTKL
jgi:hypothetical protein